MPYRKSIRKQRLERDEPEDMEHQVTNRIEWSKVRAGMPDLPKRGLHYKPEIVSAYFKQEGLPAPVFEHVHIPGRKFRLDVAWPQYKIGIEVQGGLWIKAAHSTGTGIKRDMCKRNLGTLNGWAILEYEPKDLCTEATVGDIRQLMEYRQNG